VRAPRFYYGNSIWPLHVIAFMALWIGFFLGLGALGAVWVACSLWL